MYKTPKIQLDKQTILVFIAHLPSMSHYQEELWYTLSDQERGQSRKFFNNPLRDNYILSHGILRSLLSCYVSKRSQDINFLANQYGKPFLANNKNKIQFNMSHSKEYAAYIIALENQVGIDIEWEDKDVNIEEITELVLSPTERIHFNRLNEREKVHNFYEIWTKKEAIIKAIGQGLSYPIKMIDTIGSALNSNFYYVSSDNKPYYYSKLGNLDGYVGAIASASKQSKVIQIDLNTNKITKFLQSNIDKNFIEQGF